jgi:hypothetical protein
MSWPSVYVLECSVQPGGSRWAELHTYTTPGPILRVLDRLCANEHGFFAYHTLWYGAVVGLWTIHHGEVVDFTDLHPYVSVDLREHGVIRLDQRESQAALDFNDEAEAPVTLTATPGCGWSLMSGRCAACSRLCLTPRLRPGERLILPPRLYGPAESVLPSELWWGATDLEFGELEDDPLGDDVEAGILP